MRAHTHTLEKGQPVIPVMVGTFRAVGTMTKDEGERVDACESMLLAACREAGESVTGDRRVGEATAARLLGYEASTLANWRCAGSGPEWYRIGGAGHRVSYRLRALAEWIDANRVTSR